MSMKKIKFWMCLALTVCMLVGMVPFDAFAATNEFSITGFNAYNFRGNDWYIILNTDNADFSLSAPSSLTAAGVTIDGAAAAGWFQAGTGTLAFTLATDKADHKVVIPAGTVLGTYTLTKAFVFYTHADGSVNAPPHINITGIQAYNYRVTNNDWYIILNVDNANFAMANVVSLANTGITVDGAATTGWIQKTTGTLEFSLGTDKADHEVIIPAGTMLGEYILENAFVFYTHADGSVAAGEAVEPPVDDASAFQFTGIAAYNYRGSDWYIILETNRSDLRIDAVASLQALGVTADGAPITGWFQATANNPGKVCFDVDVDKDEHTVVLPAGLELGGYTLKEDFVLKTHADGSITADFQAQPPVEDESVFQINGIAQAVYRDNNSDWYIILQTNIADFELTAISGMQAPVDNTTAQVWFQINSQVGVPTGSFGLTLAADKAEHTVTIPAGTELGGYTLKEDFIFQTHANGTVEIAPRELTITGISSYNCRVNDWYIILDTNIADFELTSVSGLQAPMDDTTAQIWFQINSQVSVPVGSFGLTLAADKAEHTVTIPAGTELGDYIVKDDFTFYTHSNGAVDTVPPSDLAGWSMTLGDNLDMNFFVSIAEADVANTSVKISVGGETILLAPEILDDETGYYKFSVELAAAQMTETVTYTLLFGESVVESNTYTIRQYADKILEGQYDESIKNLVRSMLHYGAAAQTYFGYMTESLANAQLDAPVYTSIPEQAETPMSVNGSVTGISFYGASLLFRSKTAVRFYFEASAIDGCTFTVNGKNYTPVKAENGLYYVEIDGINPQELSQSITLTVKNSSETLSVVYGPMNYIVRMGASGSAKLKDLLLAMYNYHLAAKAL